MKPAADADLLAKIEKLLALATSANEHEAKAASAKAYELLRRHNLGLDEVERQRRGYGRKALWMSRTMPGEWRHLQILLKRFFFVAPVCIKGPGVRVGVVVGLATNLAVAEYVHDFLQRSYRSLWRRRRREMGRRAGRRIGYYEGLTLGISVVLLHEGGLPPEDRLLPAAVEELIGATDDTKLRTAPKRRKAFEAGISDGLRVRIRKGVEGPAEQAGKELPCARP